MDNPMLSVLRRFEPAAEKFPALTPPAGAPCEPLDEDGGGLYDADDAELEGANVQRDDLVAAQRAKDAALVEDLLGKVTALIVRVRVLEADNRALLRHALHANSLLTGQGLEIELLQRDRAELLRRIDELQGRMAA